MIFNIIILKKIYANMSEVYFKSLSGDIITISFDEFDMFKNILQKWNKIQSILSEHMKCFDHQIVIIEDIHNIHNIHKEYTDDECEDEYIKILEIPAIVSNAQYNFFVREKDFHNKIYVCVTYNHDSYDSDENLHIYINIDETDVQTIILDVKKDNIYYILLKELNKFLWHDKIVIADRIMRQWDIIRLNNYE